MHHPNRPLCFLVGLLLLATVLTPTWAANSKASKTSAKSTAPVRNFPVKVVESSLAIAYLGQTVDPSEAVLANPDPVVTDEGVQGARLAIIDNNTTGRFIQQHYALVEKFIPADGDARMALQELVTQGYRHILLDLPAEIQDQLASLPENQQLLLYNIASRDDVLRNEHCHVNLLHLIPSRAMLADALAQYLYKKKWTKWFLVVGTEPADKLHGEAIKRAAKRFNIKIVAERPWVHQFDDARRSPQAEIPVFTQGVDYDVLMVADEADAFGDYLSYRTWLARPVAGTQGLVATAWHRILDQWGSTQLQNRFQAQAGRWMREKDYAAWLAVRAIGEAATRSRSFDFGRLSGFMRGESFALAGFKGVPLSFRSWDGQLRQPILLAGERSIVAVAPLEGAMHPKNELDTLGYDQPETGCRH